MADGQAETTKRDVPVIRIFLSSPGDVAEERVSALHLIDTVLPKRPQFRERVRLETVAWDDTAAGIALLATETPQVSVNAARPRPATCDIVIVILWSRMGTPLPDDLHKPNGEAYLSGTEWEYEDAINSRQWPRPQVFVYRRTQKPQVELDDPDLPKKQEQYQRVKAFFAQFRNADGSLKGGVNEYGTPSDFEKLLRQHLEEILFQRLELLYQPTSTAVGEPRPSATEIPPQYYGWLQRRYANVELLGQKLEKGQAITLNQVYVPAFTQPAAASANRQDAMSERVGHAKEKRPKPLLQCIDEMSLYVPAPAGAGKSTFCRWAVLQSIPGADMSHPVPAPEEFTESAPAGLRRRLPLLVPLRDFSMQMACSPGCLTWTGAELELALADWVDRSQPGGLSGDLLKGHLATGSAFLLLDGLDEVPVSKACGDATVYPRGLLLSGLGDALPSWEESGNRTLLTSRPYGLDQAGVPRLGLPHAPLQPLSEPLQDLFVTRWFRALNQPELADGLINDLHGREDLAPIAENPMLLTALCVVYGTGHRLPEDRYQLYRCLVENVLYHRFPGDVREREPIKARLEAIALGMHLGELDAPRTIPSAEIGYAETERHLAKFADFNPAYQGGRIEPAIQRDELLTRSGLLLPRPEDRAAFFHLSFQEFLAAERMARTTHEGTALEKIFGRHGAVAEWRPTLLFLFAAEIFNYRDAQWGLDLLQRLLDNQDRVTVKSNPALAVFIARAIELCLAKGYQVSDHLRDGVRRLSLEAIKDEINIQARQTLGLCLGRLGDPRINELRHPAGYVEVPAGTYPLGDEGKTIPIKGPFRIGRYPVTNSQYQPFMEDDGYSNPEWWSETGWQWLQDVEVTEPEYWHDRRFNVSNQPVVGVSFWEAEACCSWAGGRLPSEQEWEAAARGPEGLAFPWGNDWENGICNSWEAGIRATSPVGLFPRSCQARLGIEDLAGNVWDWCESLYSPDQRDNPNAGRVLRGGSWDDFRDYAHSANRSWYNPNDRFNLIGFRVVCPSPY